jgi:hypothetical protein
MDQLKYFKKEQTKLFEMIDFIMRNIILHARANIIIKRWKNKTHQSMGI